jgi:molybdenum cofactor cytidylyltransferase
VGLILELLRALRLEPSTCLALVGAGGKTTAMFQLAHQYLNRGVSLVLVTASTHLAMDQLGLADHHFTITTAESLVMLREHCPQGVILLTGPEVENMRANGLSGHLLDGVQLLANTHQAPLLIEADGSRQRPLKAPAPHEPAIPSWVDTVVVTVGLSGLGKPLDADWVHRPEIFANLSGLELDELVTLDVLARLMTHPQGGLKEIPSQARRVALLNQADTPALQASGARLAERLLGEAYSSVVVASLAPATEAKTGEVGEVFTVLEPSAGIVLAAGGSSRLGQPKQLLAWQGETLVHRTARVALEAGLSPVVVVTGAYAAQAQAALADLPVTLAHNPDWASGQSASLAAGLRALPLATGAALFLLSDQPHVPAALVRSLTAMHAETLAPIVAPLVEGKRGNPVLFDRQTFPDLMALQGDVGGRALFARYPVTWLPWHDASVLLDIDRPEDYEQFRERSRP